MLNAWQAVGSLGWLEWVNLLLLIGGALVVLGAVERMTQETPLTIKVGFVTVGAGLLGEAILYLLPSLWQEPIDTVLYGGIVALVIGTRRRTICIDPRWMPMLSGLVSAGTWLLFFASIT